VPTPPYYVLKVEDAERVRELHGAFGYPCMVKPAREGSSVGITRANNFAELEAGIGKALELDETVLVERFITGREITVAVLDGRVLGALEIETPNGIYDYEAKYQSSETLYHVPARLEPARYQGVLNIAERAVQALGTRGAVRVDLLVTEGQNEYVLEVNTLPGMTERSLLPRIAAAAGYDFADLCEAIVARARLSAKRADSELITRTDLEAPETAADRLKLVV
jgi:D-alanine-D-alanine ligase